MKTKQIKSFIFSLLLMLSAAAKADYYDPITGFTWVDVSQTLNVAIGTVNSGSWVTDHYGANAFIPSDAEVTKVLADLTSNGTSHASFISDIIPNAVYTVYYLTDSTHPSAFPARQDETYFALHDGHNPPYTISQLHFSVNTNDQFSPAIGSFIVEIIPEPETFTMLIIGLFGLAFARRNALKA